jgi:hypothetical protein
MERAMCTRGIGSQKERLRTVKSLIEESHHLKLPEVEIGVLTMIDPIHEMSNTTPNTTMQIVMGKITPNEDNPSTILVVLNNHPVMMEVLATMIDPIHEMRGIIHDTMITKTIMIDLDQEAPIHPFEW